MKTITKALVGTAAAGAVAMTSASPALARDHDRGIDAGDVIAGALVIGGIAAIAAAADNDHDRYDRDYNGRYGSYDSDDYRRGYGNGYGYDGGYRGDSSREAVEQCVAIAERSAGRSSYRGNVDVTDIRSVTRTRDGYNVRGRIAVNQMGHAWRDGDRRYGSGWNNDYRGWDTRYRGWDSGSFTCKVRYGRVADIDFNGLRGLN